MNRTITNPFTGETIIVDNNCGPGAGGKEGEREEKEYQRTKKEEKEWWKKIGKKRY